MILTWPKPEPNDLPNRSLVSQHTIRHALMFFWSNEDDVSPSMIIQERGTLSPSLPWPDINIMTSTSAAQHGTFIRGAAVTLTCP